MRTWAGMSMWAAAWFSLIMTEFTNSGTEVGDRAFIGSNSNLVAPVQVGRRRVYRVAGTTVTVAVPEGAFCVGRARREVIGGRLG